MQDTIIINSVKEIRRVAEKLLAFCDNTRVITFNGEIGAGKTTLIIALCELLATEDIVNSPTFSIVNVYEGQSVIYHMDLYRLEDIEEAIAIGIEEYLDSNDYCFIEWPEILAPILEDFNTITVDIQIINEHSRQFIFNSSWTN